MNAFLACFFELEKFKGDLIMFSLCLLIFSFQLYFLRKKRLEISYFNFLIFLIFCIIDFFFFVLNLGNFKTIVPNFLEIFMVFDFLVHNSLKILNLNCVLVSQGLKGWQRKRSISRLDWSWQTLKRKTMRKKKKDK